MKSMLLAALFCVASIRCVAGEFDIPYGNEAQAKEAMDRILDKALFAVVVKSPLPPKAPKPALPPMGHIMDAPPDPRLSLAESAADPDAPLATGTFAREYQIRARLYYQMGAEMSRVNVGGAYPFAGFQGNIAKLKIGSQIVSVPVDSITVVALDDHPELLAQYRADLERRNTRLAELGAQMDAIKQQKALDDIRSAIEAQTRELERLRIYGFGR